jgi:hypothetical protein
MNIRYIYVIGVTETGLPDHVTSGPTLGVFSSARGAHAHLSRIVEDRIKRGAVLRWDNHVTWHHNGDSVREALIENKEPWNTREILRVQKYLM